MTKAEFVESLANTLNQTKSEGERVLEAVVDLLKQALQRGDKIDIRGLGVFKVRESKPRQARNPRTGEALSVPARKVAVFKPGKELATLLNTSAEEPDASSQGGRAARLTLLAHALGTASGHASRRRNRPLRSPSHSFPHFRIGAQSGKRPAVQIHKSPVV